MIIGLSGLEGAGSERVTLTITTPVCCLDCTISTRSVRRSPRPRKDMTGSAFDEDQSESDVFWKKPISQISPLAGQVKSPGERVELNGLIGATRSSSFG